MGIFFCAKLNLLQKTRTEKRRWSSARLGSGPSTRQLHYSRARPTLAGRPKVKKRPAMAVTELFWDAPFEIIVVVCAEGVLGPHNIWHRMPCFSSITFEPGHGIPKFCFSEKVGDQAPDTLPPVIWSPDICVDFYVQEGESMAVAIPLAPSRPRGALS